MALVALLVLAPVARAQDRAQDRDGDRVADDVDLCPDVREGEATLFPGDGCPDGDGDHDGVVDDYDACPAEAETANGFQDLDGCADVTPSPGEATLALGLDTARVGCWQGGVLLDVGESAVASTSLVPRADAPTWMGTTPLGCYRTTIFDGRRAVHCQASDGREATLVMRAAEGSAIGVVAFRSAHGLDHRGWRGTAAPAFDRQRIADALEAQGDEIARCFETQIAEVPALAGRVVLRITAETSGALRVAVASDGLAPARPQVAECMVRVVSALTLADPPHCSPVTISVPFAFEPAPAE